MTKPCPLSFDENTPEYARFASFASNLFAWGRVRAVAKAAGCECKETRLGLFRRNFFVTGSVDSLNRFVRAVWDDGLLGHSFREWARENGYDV